MSQRIDVSELRQSLSEVLRRVEVGESYEVTREAVVIAVISPADRKSAGAADRERRGDRPDPTRPTPRPAARLGSFRE
jgi:prevent-host-death family protein